MASDNINFETLPGSLFKPGVYGELNLFAGKVPLPSTNASVLLVGLITAAAIADEYALKVLGVDFNSDVDAGVMFGNGSLAHLCVKSMLEANPKINLTVLPIDDDGSGVAGTGTVTFTGEATAAGYHKQWVGNRYIKIAIPDGTTAAEAGPLLDAALALKEHELLATATAVAAIVTFTSVNDGENANYIDITGETVCAGLSSATVDMASGATDVDIGAASGALDQIDAADYDFIYIPYADATNVPALIAHLQALNTDEQIGTVGMFGYTDEIGNQAAVQTLCGTTSNYEGLICAYCPGIKEHPVLLGAAACAVLAGKKPQQGSNGAIVKGVDVPAVADQLIDANLELLIKNGVAPLIAMEGNQLGIVRAVTTKITDNSITNYELLDLHKIRSLYYTRKAAFAVASQFQNMKNTSRTRALIRTAMWDLLRNVLTLPINDPMLDADVLDENEEYLIVEVDNGDATRANVRLPVAVADILHILAIRFDML